MQIITLRTTILFVLLSMVLMLSGCAGWVEYMGRSSMPIGVNGAGTLTTYQAKSYTVLGMVTAHADAKCILGIVIEGEGGNGLLWKAAQLKFGDKATGIKDIMTSYKYTGILPPIYSEIERTYVGTAVQEE